MAIANNELSFAVKAYIKRVDADANVTARQDANGVINLVGSNIPSLADLEAAYDAYQVDETIRNSQAGGFDYLGTVYSATDKDMERLFPIYMQFKEGFRVHPIEYVFENGESYAFDATNYAAFAQAFADFRNSLIVV